MLSPCVLGSQVNTFPIVCTKTLYGYTITETVNSMYISSERVLSSILDLHKIQNFLPMSPHHGGWALHAIKLGKPDAPPPQKKNSGHNTVSISSFRPKSCQNCSFGLEEDFFESFTKVIFLSCSKFEKKI